MGTMRRVSTADSRYVGVELKRLHLERGGRVVLRDVGWRIRPGERWVLAGANGAGKTQLLKLVSGAVWPTPTGRELRKYRWRAELWETPYEVQDEIGYLGAERQDKYERYGWNHPVRQIVATGLYRTDIPLNPLRPSDRKKISKVLASLDIEHLADRGFLTLSYGERRLTLLARVLASRAKLLLLDELLNGLDSTNRERALRWLNRTARSRLPWVLATHRADDVPTSATHALVLNGGRVVYRGTIKRAPLAKWLERGATELTFVPSGRAHSRTRPQVPARVSRRKPLVTLENASVYLDGREVLQGLSMSVRPGELWVVHGSNGAGKTTLLRTLYGDHGVAVGGTVRRARIVPGVPLEVFKKRVGLVAPHLQADHPHHLTVAEVVQSGRHASIGLNDAPTATDRVAARRALEFFGLAGFARRTLNELSYGQMRRVLFARAWVSHPSLLLLDEPLAGIDTPTAHELLDRIQLLVKRGAAVVMTTHHREEWPAFTSHELEIEDGRTLYCGPLRSH
jgi:molybdate transport system ATP-binding protein